MKTGHSWYNPRYQNSSYNLIFTINTRENTWSAKSRVRENTSNNQCYPSKTQAIALPAMSKLEPQPHFRSLDTIKHIQSMACSICVTPVRPLGFRKMNGAFRSSILRRFRSNSDHFSSHRGGEPFGAEIGGPMQPITTFTNDTYGWTTPEEPMDIIHTGTTYISYTS